MAQLWFNGNIYTMVKPGERVEAIVTKDGFIVATGNKQSLEQQFGATIDQYMDLKGATMLPGFVDSHMHLIGYGESLLRLDLSKMTSKKDILAAVANKVSTLEEDEWLVGEGWNENLWEDKTIITKEELDAVSGNHPVVLKRVCRHALVGNSKALKLANIHNETTNPSGGIIVKDASGNVTGFLKDAAQDLVLKVMPAYTINYLKKLLKTGIEHCYQLGLTGAHTEDLNYYGSFQNTYSAFKEVIEENEVLFRSHLLIHHGVIDEWKESGHTYLSGSSFVQFGPMKIFSDGSFGGRTALLSFPYADDPSTNGVAIHTYEQLQQLVKKAREYKMPVAVHAIGDLSFRWVLDAIEKHPLTINGRDRLIHAQALQKDMIERMKQLPVVLDIQPRFLASDFPWVMDRVGEGNIDYFYAWKTLIDAGIHCAGGSDAPIEDANPLLGIHAAVTRTIPEDSSATIYGPEERLSMYEAVSLFTTGSAYAVLNEQQQGLIKSGYYADFTILDKDIFTISASELLTANVQMTVIAGKIVYQSK
ncbi:amidohydrolase [Caldibacillus lycopersici]|uniref:Amidohydrolase n=1 Tax=Perspicuibacillus lycopersici TaxID=1325689 RepID=A0AAE3LNS7_9BACI|nr:amidohydrolase [Perspicuibacillus lycopersici]MCU9614216.1 amidohydrolase [Perspicuibacillus lycopersici]